MILLNGGGPFVPYETRDPSGILAGHKVTQFVGKIDGSVTAMAGSWRLDFVGAEIAGREGFKVAISTSGRRRFDGVCYAAGKNDATEGDLSALADKWLNRK